ncbi:hypothetical protein CR513_16531, partial [Mucuna pruriens]
MMTSLLDHNKPYQRNAETPKFSLSTIGDCTFVDTMLDLEASINVMPTSIYKSLNSGDLEPTRMTIQLENRSVVQPLGVFEDVLDMFGDYREGFNIFEAMKHPTKDLTLFGIDIIDGLVEEHMQLDTDNDGFLIFARDTNVFNWLGSITDEAEYDNLWEVHNLFDSEDDIADLANLGYEAKFFDLFDQVCKYEELEYSKRAKVQVVETKKSLSAQVAIIFTAKYDSAN